MSFYFDINGENIGEKKATTCLNIQSSQERVFINFKVKVVRFSVGFNRKTEINFGDVLNDNEYKESIIMKNQADIHVPAKALLYIKDYNTKSKPEIILSNENFIILPNDEYELSIKLLVKKFNGKIKVYVRIALHSDSNLNWFEIKANCITPDFKLIDLNNNTDIDLKNGKSTEIQLDEKNSAMNYKFLNMTNSTLFLKFSARNVKLSQEKLLLPVNQSKVISISSKNNNNCSDTIIINEVSKWSVSLRNNFPVFDMLRFKIIPNNYKKSSKSFESVQSSIYINSYSYHTSYELKFFDHPFIKPISRKPIKINNQIDFELSFIPSVLDHLEGNIKANNGQIEVNYQINYEVAELITEPKNEINFGLIKKNEKKKLMLIIKNTGKREMKLTIEKTPPKSLGSTEIRIKELKQYSECENYLSINLICNQH